MGFAHVRMVRMTTTKKKSVKKTAAKTPKKSSKELAIEAVEVISAAPIEEKIEVTKPKRGRPKKVIEPKAQKSDNQKALELANKLLKRLETKSEWTEEDEAQLAKLNKIVAILSKLIPLEGKKSKVIAELTSEEDLEIINRFVERKIARD